MDCISVSTSCQSVNELFIKTLVYYTIVSIIFGNIVTSFCFIFNIPALPNTIYFASTLYLFSPFHCRFSPQYHFILFSTIFCTTSGVARLSVAMITRWHYYIYVVMITKWCYCLSETMITRWRYCLNAANDH